MNDMPLDTPSLHSAELALAPLGSIKWLFEADWGGVIDKPAGLATLPGGSGGIKSLPQSIGVPVHRLDNDTSGCLLLARTGARSDCLRAQFTHRVLEKEYLALVLGMLPPQLIVTTPIAHHPRSARRMCAVTSATQKVRGKARRAITHLRALQYSYRGIDGSGPLTLAGVKIETGVRHQIRVHLASLGFPIVGDQLYGRKNHSDSFNFQGKPVRQLLHAWKLGFCDPDSGAWRQVVAEIPADLLAMIKLSGMQL